MLGDPSDESQIAEIALLLACLDLADLSFDDAARLFSVYFAMASECAGIPKDKIQIPLVNDSVKSAISNYRRQWLDG